MTMFAKRGRAFEAKFVHDETMIFKTEMRRDKIIGFWAARILELSPEQSDLYVKALIHVDLQDIGEEELFYKLKHDFDQKSIGQSDEVLQLALEKAMEQAVVLS